MLRRLLIRAAFAAALLFSITTVPVAAHSELVSAAPGPGDEVIGSPDELVAQFSQDLVESRSSLEVRDASGATVARGSELGENSRELRLDLPELAPGTYEVRYVTFSDEDGELHRDTYEFVVLPEPSPSPTPSATPTPAGTASVPPSPSPSATPSSSPAPTLSPSPSPDGGTGAAWDPSVIIPIAAALAVVAAMGAWLLRRRTI